MDKQLLAAQETQTVEERINALYDLWDKKESMNDEEYDSIRHRIMDDWFNDIKTVVEGLEELDMMWEEQVVTDEEYEAYKRRIEDY